MKPSSMLRALPARIWRLVTTPYEPVAVVDGFMERAETQEQPQARVTVAVLTSREARRFFGVDVARRGIQPVFLRIENRSQESVRLQMVSIDPNYFTPLEAAGVNHFSVFRRLSAFGLMGWLFLPLLALVPLKLVTAWLNNGRMDDFFRDHGFRLGPIAAGETAEGFVFTTLDLGTKAVHVRLTRLAAFGQTIAATAGPMAAPAASEPAAAIDFFFTVPVPGITADYLGRDFASIRPAAAVEACSADTLVQRLETLPSTTTNATQSGRGDPVNLVIIGDFEALLSGFVARWDESESITLATCWKTVRAFLLGSSYRYSPVSPLHLFGRDQDIALQRTRHSINERLHLRLWLAPLAFEGKPVWVGQVSRDIGVRFTTKAWNLTTHRIDPNVDESRDYCIEDLMLAGRAAAAGYVGGVAACPRESPHRNLTGDPYYTDGKRAVIVLAAKRISQSSLA
ncbi:MAG: LssY C-terminal domain-containing protein [Planctomycetia bacterium]